MHTTHTGGRTGERQAVNPRRSRSAIAVSFVVAVAAALIGNANLVGAESAPPTGQTAVAASAPLTGTASAFRPINPIRILDSRRSDAMPRLWTESAISLDPVTDTGVAEAAGVDAADITAVVVNVTMIKAGSAGFGTVWPTGSARLLTSTNNVEFEGHTIPNLVIAPLGLEGKISVYASTTADVAIDVLGAFVASEATTAGRYEAIDPTRAFDTRDADTDEFDANEQREIDLTQAGVPADATGVVMNVTAIRSKGSGFYRVWSSGVDEPSHSSVNVLGEGYQAGNQVISGVQDGKVNVFTNVGGGLTVDVTGYFTGDDPEAEPTTEGLYVPFTPGRLLDSRATSGPTSLSGGERIDPAEGLTISTASMLDIPDAGVKAIAFNLTAVRADERGFVKVYAGGAAEPATSSLNFTTGGQTVPNHAITSVSDTGIQVETSANTHLLIDATGYFLDADGVAPEAAAAVARVVEPGEFVPAALAETPQTDGPYDFLFDRGTTGATGVRPNPTIAATWPTCRPIRYALNVDLAENDEQVAVLIAAVEEIELYTGIDFQFAGVTSSGMNLDDEILLAENFNPQLQRRRVGEDAAPFKYLPPDPNGNDSVSLVIGFSNNADTLELSGPGTIGVGGSLRTSIDESTGVAEALRGFAIIDLVELYRDGPAGPATLANLKATTTHEIGHMLGLGHVNEFDPGLGPNAATWGSPVLQDQLMYPALIPGNGSGFDVGDQRGLWELYSGGFCPGELGSGKQTTDAGSGDLPDLEVIRVIN